MARRKSKRKLPKKKKPIQKLDEQFDCPFCNHCKSCEVQFFRDQNIARIWCTICFEEFKSSTNILSEAIDVYNDWMDACETVN